MAFTPEQLELYNRLSNEGDYEGAYQALYGNYVAPAPTAPAASGLLSSLNSADAGALQGLLSQFRRAEEERQFADAGNQGDGSGFAPGDEDYNYGGGLASIHRADLKMSDKDIFDILKGDRPTYDFKKLGGGLVSGAIEGLTTLHGQNKYDQAEELRKIRNDIFDMGLEGMGKFATGTSDKAGTGIYADLENAGGTWLQKLQEYMDPMSEMVMEEEAAQDQAKAQFDAVKQANQQAGWFSPDQEERYQEPSFTPSPSDKGDIFGGFSGGGLL